MVILNWYSAGGTLSLSREADAEIDDEPAWNRSDFHRPAAQAFRKGGRLRPSCKMAQNGTPERRTLGSRRASSGLGYVTLCRPIHLASTSTCHGVFAGHAGDGFYCLSIHTSWRTTCLFISSNSS